jgi:hypothetical protein
MKVGKRILGCAPKYLARQKGESMKKFALTALAILFLAMAASGSNGISALIDSSSGIEITQVKNMGLSAANAKKSIIEVRWTVQSQPGMALKSFDVAIEVSYADGAVEKSKSTVNGSSRNARFEVPTLHSSPGLAAAEMKNFKINITASYTETATKQGSF